MKKRRFKGKLIAYYLFLIVLFPFTLIFYWINFIFKKTYLTIVDEKLPQGMNGLKVVHISDLHNSLFGKEQCKILSAIEEEKPDMIVITGDLIDSNRTNLKNAMLFVGGAAKIASTYYVAGNHESRTEKYEELLSSMEDAGVKTVNDRAVAFQKNGSEIAIAGLKDPEFVFGKQKDKYLSYAKDKIGEIVSLVAPRTYTILLCHRPELLSAYIKNKIDLTFCGHAHGGQIRLPIIGGILSPGQGFFPKYTSGVYREEGAKMVVSRGLGNSAFPFRINNVPEVLVVTLKNK